jgi:hypothetical protein
VKTKASIRKHAAPATLAIALAVGALYARADVVTDWNIRAGDIMGEARLGTPPAVRNMALVQTAVYQAVRQANLQQASVEAAVASANRAVLSKLMPGSQAAIDAAAQAALGKVAEGPAKAAGIAAGEQAAALVLAQRAEDAIAPEDYRPHTTPGVYVPTASAAVPMWGKRKPWHMASASQLRPASPAALTSEAWARDYNEVKALGSKASTVRSPEQTEIARFWDYSLPPIYFGVVRSVAEQPGRDAARNARLFAAAAQAMDDALISVFDAKYQYNFWRPVTAIRNGDTDGNDATAREANWSPLIDNPMHPEYPSGHSILAASVGAVIKADVGSDRMPTLATSSPTAKGATRRWSDPDAFVREVSEARVYAGIHFRAATEVGMEMGTRIGSMAAQRNFD